MTFDPIGAIRTRTREQWHQWLVDKVTSLRIWIQENSEKSFVVALIVGFCIALFFKLFLYLVFFLVVAGIIVWAIALPEFATTSSHDDTFPRSGNS